MSSWLVSVVNGTGRAASDLHLTFSGTGGTIVIDPRGVVGGGVTPTVPSNPPAVTNEAVIDWGADVIPPCGTVWFVASTPGPGPLTFIEGFWTSRVDGARDTPIGAVENQNVSVGPYAQKLVVDGDGALSIFSEERLIRSLRRQSVSEEEAALRSTAVTEAVNAAPTLVVPVHAIRAVLHALQRRAELG